MLSGSTAHTQLKVTCYNSMADANAEQWQMLSSGWPGRGSCYGAQMRLSEWNVCNCSRNEMEVVCSDKPFQNEMSSRRSCRSNSCSWLLHARRV